MRAVDLAGLASPKALVRGIPLPRVGLLPIPHHVGGHRAKAGVDDLPALGLPLLNSVHREGVHSGALDSAIALWSLRDVSVLLAEDHRSNVVHGVLGLFAHHPLEQRGQVLVKLLHSCAQVQSSREHSCAGNKIFEEVEPRIEVLSELVGALLDGALQTLHLGALLLLILDTDEAGDASELWKSHRADQGLALHQGDHRRIHHDGVRDERVDALGDALVVIHPCTHALSP